MSGVASALTHTPTFHFPRLMTQQVSNKPGNPIPNLTTIYNAVGIAFLSLYFSPPHPHQFQFLKHHHYIYYDKLLASTIRPVLCILSLLKTIQEGEAVKPILLRGRDLLQGDLAALELKCKCAGPQSTFGYSCCLSLRRLAKPEDAAATFWGKCFFQSKLKELISTCFLETTTKPQKNYTAKWEFFGK